jgi:GT2 family glycosyltransferase/glycosyltransferase involved in cell wall biosynthesis
MLSLASACLNSQPQRAASLFATVADKYDIRHAWLGLAASRLRLGDDAQAARALAAALSAHAFVADMTILADQIAIAPTFSGWCGLTSDGALKIHSSGAGKIEVRLDGVRLQGASLPESWTDRGSIEVIIDGRQAVGSPIQIRRIRRTIGCVEAWDGGIRGWAWHPGDPDRPVKLTIICRSRRLQRTVEALTETVDVPHAGPLARPRTFSLTRSELAGFDGLIQVVSPDGGNLLGSPLRPGAELSAHRDAARLLAKRYPAHAPGRAKSAKATLDEMLGDGGPLALRADTPMPSEPFGADGRRRSVTVVIPVHNGASVTIPCLASVFAAATPNMRVVVVDDGSSDRELVTALNDLARRRKITLIRHSGAVGFTASANAGISASRGRDVVLLNSDTLVPAGWLDRLRTAAYSARDIGSVTPLSNDASILSYPGHPGTNPKPDRSTTNRLDRMAQRANGDATVDIPVGVGFCLYLRRDCLNATGLLRADIFAQGYGEENDFCLRARRLGWRHVALTGLFVGHHGGTSFDTSATHLRTRNARIVEQLHPGHDALIARFIADDPLAEHRRRIDALRWKDRCRDGRDAVVLITHNDGGGVERRIQQTVADLEAAGQRAIVLRPSERSNGERAVSVWEGMNSDFPNLVFALSREGPDLLRLLRSARPVFVEVHHLLDHDAPAMHDLIAALKLPYDVHIHDYAWFCPRLSLVGAYDRYCGEPDLPDCEACVTDFGHYLREDISVAALRRRSMAFLSRARQVIAPSDDARTRMRRHFHRLPVTVKPHGDDDATLDPERRIRSSGRFLICVVGGIGVHKGYNVLLSCARDAMQRNLNLEFVLVGHSIDDHRLMATGRCFVTGRFQPNEAVQLIQDQRAHLGFVPSIWPETWCLGLGEIWRAGLPAAAFDIGAPAERIRRTGRGFVLPLGLSASAINNALVVAAGADRYA